MEIILLHGSFLLYRSLGISLIHDWFFRVVEGRLDLAVSNLGFWLRKFESLKVLGGLNDHRKVHMVVIVFRWSVLEFSSTV